MYEMKQISEKCYDINCPAKIGVYVRDKDHVFLVDSGNDKDAGRKVRQIFDKNGWNLFSITGKADAVFRDSMLLWQRI